MIDRPKLGGGVVEADRLRRVQPNGIITSQAGDIAKSISGIITSAVGIKVRADKERDVEDKIRLTKQAEVEHIDTTNAMQGGSYDNDLNNLVSEWRGQSLTETEIRTKIKEYKFEKSVADFGLNEGVEVDEALTSYFDTYNNLEMKAITPLIESDRKAVQSKMINTGNSYIRTSKDDAQTKFNNLTTMNKSYGMGERESTKLMIQSAFDLAKRGDNSLLDQLGSVKDSEGNLLIDTEEGSEMYNKLTDSLVRHEDYMESRRLKLKEAQMEVKTTSLYTSLYDDNINLTNVEDNIDRALAKGEINISQHSSLRKTAGRFREGDTKKTSVIPTYIELRGKAERGILSQDEIEANIDKLSDTDIHALANLAIKKGGIYGVGSEESRVLSTWVNDVSKADTGLESIMQNISASLYDKNIVAKRYADMRAMLDSQINYYINENGKLPDFEEREKIRNRVLNAVKEKYKSTLDTLDEVETTTKGKPLNTKEDIEEASRGMTDEQFAVFAETKLTKEQRDLLLND